MKRALVVAAWERMFSAPARLVLLVVTALFALLGTLVSRTPGPDPGSTVLLVWILGAGVLGREASTGTLQLLLVRPVRRSEVVFSKWAALGAAASVVALAQAGLVELLLIGSDRLPRAADLGLAGVHVLSAFGAAAVLLLFSALLDGFGDVILLLSAFLATTILGALGSFAGSRFLVAAGEEVRRFLAPAPAPEAVFSTRPDPYVLVSYLSTVTLCLALAVVLLNRKEVSYASE